MAVSLMATLLVQVAVISVAEATGPAPMSLLGSGNPASNYTAPSSGDAVNDETGDFSQTFTDASISGRGMPLDLTRTYNSLSAGTSSIFGYGWSSSYGMSLNTSTTTVTQADGSQIAFSLSGGAYSPPAGNYASLVHNGSGTWTFVLRAQDTYVFNSSGMLTSESDLNGNTTSFTYNGSNQLTTVTDPESRTLSFAYNGSGYVSSVTDPLGRVTTYGYDAYGDLTSVIDPMGRMTSFTYNTSSHLLLTFTDPNAQSDGPDVGDVTANTYNSHNEVSQQTDPADLTTTWSYDGGDAANNDTSSGWTEITDPHGSVTKQVYAYDVMSSSTTGYGTSSADTTNYTFDGDNDPATVEDPNLNTTTYTYSTNGDLLTSKPQMGSSYETQATYNSMNEPLTQTPASPDPATTDAYDTNGNLLTSTTNAGSGGGTSYTLASSADSDGFNTISCPTPTLCVAAAAGGVYTSNDPTGGPSAWTATGIAGAGDIESISCPTTTFCAASDQSGNVETSTNPTGGASAWTKTTLAAYDILYSISCASATLCVVGDQGGDVFTSTNPTGGASAWTEVSVDAGDGFNGITGMSCPSTTLCVGTDDSGNIVTSTNPTGGFSAWTVTNIDGSTIVRGVDCPSTKLCVATDDSGNVVTSTNPTGGSSAWSKSNVDSSNDISAVSCPSAGLCVVADAAGNVLASTDPTGGSSAWSSSDVDGSAWIWALACPTGDSCVGSDSSGNVLVLAGKDPTTIDIYGNSSHPGDLTETIDPAGHVTTYTYDSYGNVTTTTTYPSPGVTDVTEDVYDADGEKLCEASPSAVANGINCPSAGSARVAGTTTWTYNADGEVLTETDPLGHVTTSVYDNDGNAIDSVDPLGNVTNTSYDPDDRVTKTSSGYLPALSSSPVQQSSSTSGKASISAVGTLASAGSNGLTTLSFSPSTAGDAVILSVLALSSTATVTSVSGGGVTTWAPLEQYQNSYPSDEELWMGTVTTTGSSTITVAFSTSVSSDYVELNAQEFTAGLGSSTVWSKDTGGDQTNPSSTSVPLPSLSPSGPSELYFGYGAVDYTGSAGSTSGFTYDVTSGSNVVAYDTNASSNVSPSADQSPGGNSVALAALLSASGASSASHSGSTETVTLPNYVKAGDGLTLSFENVFDTKTISSISGGGGIWAKANQENNSSSSADNELWYLQNSAGGPGTNSITINLSGTAADTYAVNVAEWRGALALDQAPSGTTGTGTTLSSPSVTPTYANEIVLAAGGANNAPTGAMGGGLTGLTLTGTIAGSSSLYAVAGYVSASGTSAQQMTQGIASSVAWSGTAASFVLIPAFGSSTPVQQSSSASHSGSTETVTLPANVTVGDGLTLSFENVFDTKTISSISGGGGVWVKANQENNSSTSADDELWYLQNSAGGSGTTSITITLSGTAADTYAVNVAEWRGALALDQAPTGTSGSGMTLSAPSVSASYANEIVLASGGAKNSPVDAMGGGFSALTLTGTNAGSGTLNAVAGYVSALGTSAQQLTQGLASSVAWSGTSASFTVGDTTENGYDLTPGATGPCSSSVSGAIYCTTTTDGNNQVTVDYFDTSNEEIETVAPGSITTTISYYHGSDPYTTTTTAAGATKDVYNNDNKLTNIDYSGTASGYTAPTNVTYAYNDAGQRTSMTDGTGTTTYTYNGLGQMTSTQNGAGATVSYGYDLDNEVTSITYPSGQSVTYAYDGAGEMTQLTDLQGRASNFSYSSTSSSSGPKLVSSYANGTTTTATSDGDGGEVGLTTTGPTLGISYTRNADEDITAETTSVSGGTWYSLGDGYDPAKQVSSTSASGLSNDTGPFAYDPAGNPTSTLSPTTGSAVTQSFNGAQELTGTTSGSTTLSYGYDSIGDRTSAAVTGGSSTAYTYSQTGQLLSETPSGSSAITYGYNGDGLRMSKSASGTTDNYTYDTLGSTPQLLQDGSTAFIYGPTGNVVEQEQTSAGNSISAVGSLVSNSGTGLTSLSVSPSNAGDALILSVWALSSTATVSSISGGGVAAWTPLDSFGNSYPSDQELWMGKVTTTGSSSITVTFSTSVSSDHVELSAQEFTAGLGSSTVWSKDTAKGQNNASSTSVPLPSLTPSGSHELYFGYGGVANTATGGSTSGFTYALSHDSNQIAYDSNVSSTVSPSAAQTPAGASYAVAAVIIASTGGAISAVGSLANNSGTGLTTLSISPQTAGDAVILGVFVGSSTPTVSSVSGGGVTSWSPVEQYTNSFPSDQELWMGTVTTTGTSTITVTFSSSVASDHVELVAQEFTAGLGTSTVWSKDTAAGQLNASSTSAPLPSLTPSGNSELYFGYDTVANAVNGGSTSGFTYADTIDSNAVVYDAHASSTVSPTATQSPAGTSVAVAALVTASLGSPLFYVDDSLGSTQWLVNLSGSVVGSYAYSTYGSTLSHTGSASTPIDFAGAYTDAETGFLYLINRYYDPVTAEFVTVDPEVAATLTPYNYAGDDPVNVDDPAGKSVIGCILSPLSCLVGGIGTPLIDRVSWGCPCIGTNAGFTLYVYPSAVATALGLSDPLGSDLLAAVAWSETLELVSTIKRPGVNAQANSPSMYVQFVCHWDVVRELYPGRSFHLNTWLPAASLATEVQHRCNYDF